MKIIKMLKQKLFSLPDDKQDKFYRIYYSIRYPNQMEKRKSFGTLNKDKIIYLIRPRTDGVEGLMALFLNVVINLYYAEKHNYCSVVDFKNYHTQYQDEKSNNVNVWEYYFTQPSDISLDSVYKSKNVILSGLLVRNFHYKIFEMNFNDDVLKEAHDFIFKHIQFSQEVLDIVERESQNFELENMLGLYLRGTDYTKLKPAGHPIQPTLEEAFYEIDKYKEFDFKGIFLVTEDGEIYREVKEKYGEFVSITSFDRFIDQYDGKTNISLDGTTSQLAETPYERGMNYLVKLIMLSRCKYLIAGKTTGSWGACVFKEGKYDKKTIFELGKY